MRLSAPAAQLDAPEIAVDGSGDAVAVWHTWVGGQSAVFAAVRRGESWGAAAEISVPGEASFAASVDVQAGRAIVVWAAIDGGLSVIRSRSHLLSDTDWGPVETVSLPTSHAYRPRVALDDAGNAVAVWRWWRSGYFVVQSAARTGSGWSLPEDLSAPGEDAEPPRVAVDGAGNAVAAWLRPVGPARMAQVAVRPVGGAWSSAENLSHRGGSVTDVVLAANRAGDFIVGWRHRGVFWSSIRGRGRSAWGDRESTKPACRTCNARVAIDEEGNATAAWASGSLVEASFRRAGSDWLRGFLLSRFDAYADRPDVAISSPGVATAVGVRDGETHDRVQSVTYDLETAEREQAAEDALEECYENAETDEEFEECERRAGDDGEDAGAERILVGTHGRDVLVGTPGDDVIWGLGGADVIEGRGGHDLIFGGDGRDLIVGGRGPDLVDGGPGSDRVFGGVGTDRLRGGRGRDALFGGTGADTLLDADGARDVAIGGIGFDRFRLDRRLDRARSVDARL